MQVVDDCPAALPSAQTPTTAKKGNMKRKIILIAFLFLSTMVFGQAKNDTLNLKREAFENIEMEQPVSLISLIANPQKFDGKKVKVIGYLHLEFESEGFYLHKEDFENSISKNGFFVNFSPKLTRIINPKDYNDKYVMIVGTFSISRKGHMDLFAGGLVDIKWVKEWGTWK